MACESRVALTLVLLRHLNPIRRDNYLQLKEGLRGPTGSDIGVLASGSWDPDREKLFNNGEES